MPRIKIEGLHEFYELDFYLIAKDTTAVNPIIEDAYMPIISGVMK